MKKKIFMIVAGLVILSAYCGVNAAPSVIPPEVSGRILDKIMETAEAQKLTWKQLYTCTRGKTPEGSLIIYGKAGNGLCHFKHSNYDCKLPSNVLKQYAAAGLKSLEEISSGKFSTVSLEDEFMDKIHNNPQYCSVK